MKILVLGNGFDVDHDLPTSYLDFLRFCNCVIGMDTMPNIYKKEKLKKSQIKYLDEIKANVDLKNKFVKLLKNNHLLNYFNAQQSETKENWIDLEREIKSIIDEFRSAENELKNSNLSSYSLSKEHKLHSVLKKLGLSGLAGKDLTAIKLMAIHKDLCVCLERFACALELYIHQFINNTDVEGIAPDIIEFDANKVLVFNYSNTYERVYGGIRWNEEVDHIHGIAQEPVEENSNIILGVTSGGEWAESSYVEFEKYYQRITKRTGSNHKKWLSSRLGKTETIEIAFFGHSLDATDGDVIKDLIINEKTNISIFYHDEKAYKQIVANLIQIIGKESFVSFVHGKHPKIKFIKQQLHQKDNTGGLEITRDIRKLYSLYKCSEEEIYNLIDKITNKLKSKDTSYFYSQSKVISMFEALRFHTIITKGIKKFADICALLDYEVSNSGRLKFYHEEDWYDYEPWGEEIPCDSMTVKLISAVNTENKSRYDKDQSLIPYYCITQMTSSEEIKDALLEAFSIGIPTENYWKELENLINNMPENKLLEKALSIIDKQDLPLAVRSKFKYFKTRYWNVVFNIQYNRQIAEEYEERKRHGEEDI